MPCSTARRRAPGVPCGPRHPGVVRDHGPTPARTRVGRMTALVIAHRGASGTVPSTRGARTSSRSSWAPDAIEPDLVPTADGVLVLRHEKRDLRTTDVADHAAFRDRRTTKTVDGQRLTGCSPRLHLDDSARCGRANAAAAAARLAATTARTRSCGSRTCSTSSTRAAPVGLVAEVKHATYFAGIGLPMTDGGRRDPDRPGGVTTSGSPSSASRRACSATSARGARGRLVYLQEARGSGRGRGRVPRVRGCVLRQRTDRPGARRARDHEFDGISVDLKT